MSIISIMFFPLFKETLSSNIIYVVIDLKVEHAILVWYLLKIEVKTRISERFASF